MLLPLRWLLYGYGEPSEEVEETGQGGKRLGIRHRKPKRLIGRVERGNDSRAPEHISWTEATVPTQYELRQIALKKQIREEDELLAIFSALL